MTENRSCLLLEPAPLRLPAARPSRRRPTPFWRRRDWQLWRQNYLEETPANRRGAWVKTVSDDSEAGGQETVRSQLAMVPDISLGSIQLRSWSTFASGTLLRVQLWDHGAHGRFSLLVRVLQVAMSETVGEWLHSCTFVAEN